MKGFENKVCSLAWSFCVNSHFVRKSNEIKSRKRSVKSRKRKTRHPNIVKDSNTILVSTDSYVCVVLRYPIN